MNTSTEGFRQCYNVQVTVEGEHGRGPHQHWYSGLPDLASLAPLT